MLIVLDNARDTEQVRPLLPGTAGCLVIVTSRNQLSGLVAGEGAHPLTLDLLAPAEARELLTRRLGAGPRWRPSRSRGRDHRALRRGCRWRWPSWPPGPPPTPTFRSTPSPRNCASSHGSLDAFTGTDAATDVRAVFSWSYHALPPAAARLFRLLALHPGPDISAPAAAASPGCRCARPARCSPT